MQSFEIPSEEAMLALGNRWARRLGDGAVVFLSGDLGAGKTTLARGILNGMGHRGAVPSPTYTLVEHYPLAGRDVYHVDLYRLEDPAELEMTGLRDLLDGASILLVEWPQRGGGLMPIPDFQVTIHDRRRRNDNGNSNDNDNSNENGRRVSVLPAAGLEELPGPC